MVQRSLSEERPALHVTVRDYAIIVVGTLLLSVGYAVFMVPLQINAGGVSGLAVTLHYLTHLPTGPIIFVLNVPLLLLGYRLLGGLRFTVRTLVSVIIFSVTIDPIEHYAPVPTHDLFLASLYGGVIAGVGIGLVFGRNASTGGTTIVARLIQRGTRISSGIAQLLVDAVVVGIAALVFGPQVALYSLICLFVTGKAIDWALEGLSGERVAFIITPRADAVSARIMHDLGRGTTLLPGRGGYTGQPRPIVFCVLDRAQERALRAIVQAEDPQAFLTVTAATTVLGEGFTPLMPSPPLRSSTAGVNARARPSPLAQRRQRARATPPTEPESDPSPG